MTQVVVLDYGSGNVRSAVRALESAGAHVTLTSGRDAALEAEGLVIPGVGAFNAVMEALERVEGHDIVRTRHQQNKPTLGICVGQQILFQSGTEHGITTSGVALWPGTVTHLNAPVVPHMGWNTVTPAPGSAMFAGVENEHFYFVHSYAAHTPVPGALNTTSTHGEQFIAAVEDGPTWATQFHPEKSGDAGLTLLTNWLKHVRSKEKQ
ncbi:imidazole glycerol phosphate synthase, glutamine amidotransferase subunit [Brevibacterium mcbrellneri ATCC 49030]|uniref:Imidazole glycerol phosphate synthase subunit HisH n=1 Tax=Brevibacterium mcbrellneri ATCC 49030 TaxID=585530 RepID=D4YMG0_9MICO|nr:imidazole glycerol phosphate synthase subunit HisH [Brevibacterium mcbrellneri]EFG47621.1 imidazole glycerol phosphate synthase, glutamine amidotransferase subunit [Brevibacterium mcbrellneri ATCC 49030]